jgi:hypothetical protein
MSRSLVDMAAGALEARTTRRSFIVRAALAGSALTVAPLRYLLRPGGAYAAICGCSGQACDCGSACCDGYTDFCCTMHGKNTCPPGTFAGGWWKADGSAFCAGPRYYIDCHHTCSCTSGCGPFCAPECENNPGCRCAEHDCNHRALGCNRFRYGQCHQEIACVGRIACRVVSCTPAWLLDGSCSSATTLTDNATRNHTANCPPAPQVPVTKEYDMYLVATNEAQPQYFALAPKAVVKISAATYFTLSAKGFPHTEGLGPLQVIALSREFGDPIA